MGWGRGTIAAFAGAAALACGSARAAPCPNPNALGVSRVLPFNSNEMPRVGSHDYRVTLPLARGEVVLTFDDGPIRPNTQRVLKALADQCVKAVFFLVGRQAKAHPHMVRQIHAAGHTIGTHSQNHPLHAMPPWRAEREINAGIESISAALGDPGKVAPFFRFPGLYRTAHAERYLRSRGISAWSIDVDSFDWKKIDARTMVHNTLARLGTKRRGIILLHDIQSKTALMLPTLLAELKRRGYRVVHVIPSGKMQPPPAPELTPVPAPVPAPAPPRPVPPAPDVMAMRVPATPPMMPSAAPASVPALPQAERPKPAAPRPAPVVATARPPAPKPAVPQTSAPPLPRTLAVYERQPRYIRDVQTKPNPPRRPASDMLTLPGGSQVYRW
jgi:peptidoglycan/xylan/chitin deacetylase (PgdA/CDA1 family)